MTPSNLIDAIITEKGVIEKKPGESHFRIQEFLDAQLSCVE